MNEHILRLREIMMTLYHLDLSIYETEFLRISLNNRMKVLSYDDFDDYLSLLEIDGQEANHFRKSLDVYFTGFFRNQLTYALLEDQVIPKIIHHKPPGSEIRVWSAGCATGQEPYSLAILLNEILTKRESNLSYRIIATDSAIDALVAADQGIYKEKDMEALKWCYINKYFFRDGEDFIVKETLKKHINFAYYDLLDESSNNPPISIFGSFDLIMCCNVLIYYNPKAQKYIAAKLSKALDESGYLITNETEKHVLDQCSIIENQTTTSSIYRRK